MKILDIKVSAGTATPVAISGKFFRVLDGSQDITVTFGFASGREIRTIAMVGVGCQFENKFINAVIESAVDQTVRIAYSSGVIDDARLVGSVSASIAACQSFGEQLTPFLAATATRVVDPKADRIKATLSVNQSGYLWHDNTVNSALGSEKGLPVTAGAWVEITNTSEMWFMANTAGSAVVLEETLL